MERRYAGKLLVATITVAGLAAGCRSSAPAPVDATVPSDAGSDAGADASIDACGTARTVPSLTTVPVGSGFSEPVFLASVPGTDDLAVVERLGRIRIVRNGAVLTNDFLTITSSEMLDSSGYLDEQGLLGLAFHPDYATNGRFFIFRTFGNDDPGGRRNTVLEYRRSTGNPDIADPTPVQVVLDATSDPASNHNGGMITFGPDGMLYVGIGDGGGAQDAGHGPSGNALNTGAMFGKIHRLDVDSPGNGFVPADPIFTGASEVATLYAYGLRNPWRFSFDAASSTLFVGDVGQDAWEEIDAIDVTAGRGVSFGWALREGLHDTNYAHITAPAGYSTAAEVSPIVELGHSGSTIGAMTAVVGGYVYRGSAIPALQGFYVFGDTGGAVGVLRYCEGRAADVQKVNALSTGGILYSFAVDAAGELYMLHGGGVVRRIVAP